MVIDAASIPHRPEKRRRGPGPNDPEVLIWAAVRKKPRKPGLPAYASMMADYHRAFAPELKEIIQSLPIRRGERILDFACGDGSYARWLARRVGSAGKVLALDISPGFLDAARRAARRSASGRRIQFLQADIHHRPLAENSLDLVWCAQSLYSLPDPIDALRRMAQAVRPGGQVAVLENDEFQHVLFPWPVEIELALKKAELLSFVETSDRPRKYYVGRDLCRLFRAAGLSRCKAKGVVFTRQSPLDDAARSFFTGYLGDLLQRVGPHLEPSLHDLFDRLADPLSNLFLLSSPDLTVTCVNQVVLGLKSSQQRMRRLDDGGR